MLLKPIVACHNKPIKSISCVLKYFKRKEKNIPLFCISHFNLRLLSILLNHSLGIIMYHYVLCILSSLDFFYTTKENCQNLLVKVL